MEIEFHKFQGTGNDFIIIDNRECIFTDKSPEKISKLCNRHFGIGADGLILLELADGSDFHMAYFNSDGNESSMCGNGGRCIVRFAQQLGIVKNSARFTAMDGEHLAEIFPDRIKLKMKEVDLIHSIDGNWVLNTGSPHYIKFLETIDDSTFVDSARKIRYSEPYFKEGINVNFVQIRLNDIYVRTYERGVETETMSCGTGCTAAAIAYHVKTLTRNGHIMVPVSTPGGDLKVYFHFDNFMYKEVWLEGAADAVFRGTINDI